MRPEPNQPLRNKEFQMIIHQREIAYTSDYQTFFEALVKA